MTLGTRPKSILAVVISCIMVFFILSFQAVAIGADQLPADDFNDNNLGDMWRLIRNNPPKLFLQETNQRLEGRSTGEVEDDDAVCISNQWQLSTDQDFAMQIDWHFSSLSLTAGLFFGIIADQSGETFVNLNVERDEGIPSFYVDAAEGGNEFYDDDILRTDNDGVFYVSYESATDRLYVSVNGYRQSENPDNGDWVFEGLLKGDWNLDSIIVDMGFYDEDGGIRTDSGDAYFDNFFVTEGSVIGTSADDDDGDDDDDNDENDGDGDDSDDDDSGCFISVMN